MFILTITNSAYRHHTNDIATLKDIVLGLTGNEFTATRIANIAGNMRFGDVFSNPEMYLKCVMEEFIDDR